MMKKQNKNKKKQPKPIKEVAAPQKEKGVDMKDTQISCKQSNKAIMILTKIKRITTCITSSLWFRIPIIFLFTLIIIRVIFMFSPKNASLYFESDNTRTIHNINAHRASVELNTDSITIASEEKVVISFNKGVINGEEIDSVSIRNPYLMPQLNIVPKFGEAKIIIEKIDNTASDSAIHIFPERDVVCNINAANEMFGNAPNEYFAMSSENFTIMNKNDCILYFQNCDVFTFDANEIVDDCVTIQYIDGEIGGAFNGIRLETTDSSSFGSTSGELINLSVPLNSLSGKSEFYNVSNVEIQGKGELNFALPSSISKYDLNLLDLYLKSDDNNLVVTCDFSKENEGYFKANVNGIVNDAKIANYDLFPTFKGWIANNIFLLPTAIISSVLIPILLDISKGLLKKKKDDEEEE